MFNQKSSNKIKNGQMHYKGYEKVINCPEASEYLQNLEQIAYNYGLNEVFITRKNNGIQSAVWLNLENARIQLISKYNFLKTRLGWIETSLKQIKGERNELKKQVKLKRKKVKLPEAILYTLSGIMYVFAEIEFSRQIIIPAWGMGQDSIFSKIALITGIALTTVVVKLAYERFIESQFREGDEKPDKIFLRFYLFLLPVVIFFFLYLGYLRAVIFKYSKLTITGSVYDILYTEYPYMNTIAFIGIGFIFLFGGAVLLTVGLKELRFWFRYRQDKKFRKKLGKQQGGIESNLESMCKDFHQIEALYNAYTDDKSFKNMVKNRIEFYKSIYQPNYLRGLNERKNNQGNGQVQQDKVDLNLIELPIKEKESHPNDQFHVWVRKLLDENSRKGSFTEGRQEP